MVSGSKTTDRVCEFECLSLWGHVSVFTITVRTPLHCGDIWLFEGPHHCDHLMKLWPLTHKTSAHYTAGGLLKQLNFIVQPPIHLWSRAWSSPWTLEYWVLVYRGRRSCELQTSHQQFVLRWSVHVNNDPTAADIKPLCFIWLCQSLCFVPFVLLLSFMF